MESYWAAYRKRKNAQSSTPPEPDYYPKSPVTEPAMTDADTDEDSLPMRLTQKSQHHLLAAVQGMLEKSCFNFAKEWLPKNLAAQNVTCSEAVDLSCWSSILPAHFSAIPEEAINVSTWTALKHALEEVICIRNAVVLRQWVSCKEVVEMLQKALDLASILQDQTSCCQLVDLLKRLDSIIRDVKPNKDNIELEYCKAVKQIDEQRDKLNRQEEQLKLQYLQDLNEEMSPFCETLMGLVSEIRKENEG